MFVSYWLYGLRLSALDFADSWVEPDLGAEMRISGRPHCDKYFWGSDILC